MRLAFLSVSTIGVVVGLLAARPPAPAAAPVASVDTPVETVLERADSGHFLATAAVNDEPIRFLVDTGADTVALTMEDARRAHVAFDPTRFTEIGRGAGGPVRGEAVQIAVVSLDGKRAGDVGGVVLEGADVSLLGQTYLRRLGEVHIAGDRMTLR